MIKENVQNINKETIMSAYYSNDLKQFRNHMLELDENDIDEYFSSLAYFLEKGRMDNYDHEIIAIMMRDGIYNLLDDDRKQYIIKLIYKKYDK